VAAAEIQPPPFAEQAEWWAAVERRRKRQELKAAEEAEAKALDDLAYELYMDGSSFEEGEP